MLATNSPLPDCGCGCNDTGKLRLMEVESMPYDAVFMMLVQRKCYTISMKSEKYNTDGHKARDFTISRGDTSTVVRGNLVLKSDFCTLACADCGKIFGMYTERSRAKHGFVPAWESLEALKVFVDENLEEFERKVHAKNMLDKAKMQAGTIADSISELFGFEEPDPFSEPPELPNAFDE